MKNQVIYMGGLALALSWLVVYYCMFGMNLSSSNSDFICIKQVTNQPCRVTSCGQWQKDGTRTCEGVKTTKVAYYLIRTNCEPGYTRISKFGGASGSSGRQGADYIYSSAACTIVQTDHVAPIGSANSN